MIINLNPCVNDLVAREKCEQSERLWANLTLLERNPIVGHGSVRCQVGGHPCWPVGKASGGAF
jgi:hypothetical protein